MSKNQMSTPNLDLLLTQLRRVDMAPNLTKDAIKELHELKLFAANQHIQNYCENFGVPNEVMTDDENVLIDWATRSRQTEINNEGKRVTEWDWSLLRS